jgi:hypothetical protein
LGTAPALSIAYVTRRHDRFRGSRIIATATTSPRTRSHWRGARGHPFHPSGDPGERSHRQGLDTAGRRQGRRPIPVIPTAGRRRRPPALCAEPDGATRALAATLERSLSRSAGVRPIVGGRVVESRRVAAVGQRSWVPGFVLLALPSATETWLRARPSRARPIGLRSEHLAEPRRLGRPSGRIRILAGPASLTVRRGLL